MVVLRYADKDFVCTNSAKHHLKRISGRERRHVSKAIVEEAVVGRCAAKSCDLRLD